MEEVNINKHEEGPKWGSVTLKILAIYIIIIRGFLFMLIERLQRALRENSHGRDMDIQFKEDKQRSGLQDRTMTTLSTGGHKKNKGRITTIEKQNEGRHFHQDLKAVTTHSLTKRNPWFSNSKNQCQDNQNEVLPFKKERKNKSNVGG